MTESFAPRPPILAGYLRSSGETSAVNSPVGVLPFQPLQTIPRRPDRVCALALILAMLWYVLEVGRPSLSSLSAALCIAP
jgi:hypothetical protein